MSRAGTGLPPGEVRPVVLPGAFCPSLRCRAVRHRFLRGILTPACFLWESLQWRIASRSGMGCLRAAACGGSGPGAFGDWGLTET